MFEVCFFEIIFHCKTAHNLRNSHLEQNISQKHCRKQQGKKGKNKEKKLSFLPQKYLATSFFNKIDVYLWNSNAALMKHFFNLKLKLIQQAAI